MSRTPEPINTPNDHICHPGCKTVIWPVNRSITIDELRNRVAEKRPNAVTTIYLSDGTVIVT